MLVLIIYYLSIDKEQNLMTYGRIQSGDILSFWFLNLLNTIICIYKNITFVRLNEKK